MRTYTVTFFNSDDTVSRVDTIESSNDDVILDEVGSLPYRHADVTPISHPAITRVLG